MWARIFLTAIACLVASPVAAHTAQTGTFVVEDTPFNVLGDQARVYAPMTAVDARKSWVVHVSPGYNPDHPAGIVVYVSPSTSGDVPLGWDGVLDSDNLIWISARDDGNDVETRRRIYDTILALALVRKNYVVDPRRIYLAGFSGGGRVAGIMMSTAPYLFNGAVYMCGVDFHKAENADLAARMVGNRYVFMTGSKDFNRSVVRQAYDAYVKAGASSSRLMDINNLTHTLPSAEDFAAALAFLDEGGTKAQ